VKIKYRKKNSTNLEENREICLPQKKQLILYYIPIVIEQNHVNVKYEIKIYQDFNFKLSGSLSAAQRNPTFDAELSGVF
jgi:hypothetical protein